MSLFFKNKRGVQALVLLMLISAVLHMVVLCINFVVNQDYAPFNFFRIIGLDIFFPEFVANPPSNYISVIVILGIYFLSYIYLTKKQK